MGRAISTTVATALVIGLLIGGVAAFALPALAADLKPATITITDVSTTTATSTSVSTTTATSTSTSTTTSTTLLVDTLTSTQVVLQTTTFTSTTTEPGSTSSLSSPVVLYGTLTVPSGSGAGILVITVDNEGSVPINAVTVAVDYEDSGLSLSFAPMGGGFGGDAVPGGGPVTVLCGPAMAVGCEPFDADAIPPGMSASVIADIIVNPPFSMGATAGTSYTFSVSTYLGSSTLPYIVTFGVTAQV
ncbi:MAG: hypothetical protein OK456_01285 [Thaumarchaeota archaeon]|nr:hypothetical protein [Nitrososphaerota archaeon]